MPRIINMTSRFAAAKGRSSSNNANKDTLAPLLAIAPNFKDIGIGQGMAFDIPEGSTALKFMASIRGKIIAAIREGQPLEKHKYSLVIDRPEGSKEQVLLIREENTTEALPKKIGGKKKETAPKAVTNLEATKQAMADQQQEKGEEGAQEPPKAPDAPANENKGNEGGSKARRMAR